MGYRMRLTFIGGGNMASALIGGILARGGAVADIQVADVMPQACERLHAEFGVAVHESPVAAIAGSECVVLAVKPQQLRAVAIGLAAHVGTRLVLSIAAGIRTDDLSRWLGGHARIVRAMPNTPALVRAGITAVYALPAVTPAEREAMQQTLSAAGKVLWVAREQLLDAVTAVSGSGPAYAFYLIEAMQDAAMQLGFDADTARLLSVETVLGAARLAEASDASAAVLRERVTSKGGTTERALSVLEARGVKQSLVDAMLAAEARSRELGDAFRST